jgi:putative ATP-dependent endonuclease of the OLD family
MQFLYTRYKRGPQTGTRRLEQTCFDETGKQPIVMTGYAKRGTPPKFEPLLGIPQEAREAVPLIYIGTDRSLRRQLPSQQYSLLRRIFEDINEDFQNPENKAVVRDREGNERVGSVPCEAPELGSPYRAGEARQANPDIRG